MGTTRNAEVVLVESVSKRRHRSKQERRAVVEVGRARIRVEGSVDAEALRLILERVGR